MERSISFHQAHNEMNQRPSHFARVAAQHASAALGEPALKASLHAHRAANRAKHHWATPVGVSNTLPCAAGLSDAADEFVRRIADSVVKGEEEAQSIVAGEARQILLLDELLLETSVAGEVAETFVVAEEVAEGINPDRIAVEVVEGKEKDEVVAADDAIYIAAEVVEDRTGETTEDYLTTIAGKVVNEHMRWMIREVKEVVEEKGLPMYEMLLNLGEVVSRFAERLQTLEAKLGSISPIDLVGTSIGGHASSTRGGMPAGVPDGASGSSVSSGSGLSLRSAAAAWNSITGAMASGPAEHARAEGVRQDQVRPSRRSTRATWR